MKWMTKYAVLALAALAPAAWAADALDVWTASDSGTQNNLQAIAYGNGQFVAVGNAGTILTSPDGIGWTKRDSGIPHWLLGVTFGGGQFVAVGGDPPSNASVIITSVDGIKWTPRETTTTNCLYAITHSGEDRFIAVGGGSRATVVSSSDGFNWTLWGWKPTNPITDPPALFSIVYGNGLFVAVYPGAQPLSSYQPAIFISTNGIDWSQYDGPNGVRTLTYGNKQFVGVGGFWTTTNRVLVGYSVIYSSPDGINWKLRKAVIGTSGDSFYGVSYGAGQFVVAGNRSVYSSSDGTNWMNRGATATLRGISFGNGQFISVGDGGIIKGSGIIGKLGASLYPNGPFLGTITGVNGQNYSIQSSTNFGDWHDLTRVTISNGIGQFNDPSATNLLRRFYKASLVE